MRVQARQHTRAQDWFARLSIAGCCGGIVFAICVVPNANNPRFSRWLGPLAIACFGGPILTAVLTRFCVDRNTDYNDGYNDALSSTSEAPAYVPPTPISPAQQPSAPVLTGYTVTEHKPPVGFSGASPDDEFAFLDARAQ
jgi:hypothetical protein